MPPDTAERRPLGKDGAPEAHIGGGSRTTITRRRPAAAYVSLYLPAGRRKWHWYSYMCRTCGVYQLGRARQLDDVAGTRRAGCGHEVTIVIARIYGHAS